MPFELYLSNNVRRQTQFEKYIPFCSDISLLPDCKITIFEQDRDEHLYTQRDLAFRDTSSESDAYPLPAAGYYGVTWKDGIIVQCGSVHTPRSSLTGLAYIHESYHEVDVVARTDRLGTAGLYNLLLSSYQYVAVNAGALLTHSAAVIYKGEAILFCGASGDGKSTQAAAWIKHYSAKPINFDHPCIIWNNGKPIAYGTPWGGKEGYCMPVGAPVRAIVFVKKSTMCSLHELREGEAFSHLLLINSLPHIRSEMDKKMMTIVKQLVKSVPVYFQECTLTRDTPEMLYNVLYGTTK